VSRNSGKVKDLSRQAHEIIRRADEESRDLTINESREVTALLDQIEAHKKAADGANEVQRSFGNAGPVRADGRAVYGNPGGAFTASEGYKQIKDARGQAWTTGPVEVGIESKGTLLEGTGSPGSGTGGGLVPIPDVTPGVVANFPRHPLASPACSASAR
jgi:hypothetical protein